MRSGNKQRGFRYPLNRYVSKNNLPKIADYIEKHKKDATAFTGQTEDDTPGLSFFAWCFGNGHYDLVRQLLLSACPIDAAYLNLFPQFAAKFILQLLDGKSEDHDHAAKRLLSCPKFNVNIKDDEGIPILFAAAKKATDATLQALLERRPLDPDVQIAKEYRYAVLCQLTKPSSAERDEIASLETALERISLDVTIRTATNTVLTDDLLMMTQGRLAVLLSDPQIKKLMLNEVDSERDRLTPLAKAIWGYHLGKETHAKINRLLDEPSVDVLAVNSTGETPLSIRAKIHGNDVLMDKMFEQHIIPKCRAGILNWNDERIIQALHVLCTERLSPTMQELLFSHRYYLCINLLTSAFVAGDHKQVDTIVNDNDFNPYFQINADDNYVTYALKYDASGALYKKLKNLKKFEDAAQYGNTFVAAASAGKLQEAHELIRNYRVNPNCLDTQSAGVLHRLAAKDDFASIKPFLAIDDKTDINTPNGIGDTFLHVLIRKNIDIQRYLNFFGLDLNAVNYQNETPLNLAIKLDNYTAALSLLNKRYFAGITVLNVNIPDREGNSPLDQLLLHPLHDSQIWEDLLILILRLQELDVRYTNAYKQTYLMIAAQHGLVEAVKMLLERSKENVNERDEAGDTALILAARAHDKAAIAEMLLDAGADCFATNRQGGDALKLATANNHLAFVNRLSIFAAPAQRGPQEIYAPSAPALNE